MNVLITGSSGFIGRNLAARLSNTPDCSLALFDIENRPDELRTFLAGADIIFHLAGVNRPADPVEFQSGNTALTATICDLLRDLGRQPRIAMTSSIQAEADNPYGRSKRLAEDELKRFSADTGAPVRIFRLKNVFGKWCRPNYNSVVATFCNNIAKDLPISISDPATSIDLIYVDDAVEALLAETQPGADSRPPGEEIPSYRISLGELAGRIQAFRDMRDNLLMPDFASPFNKALYATYLSYVSDEGRNQPLAVRSDNRGALAEFIKSESLGQIFVSRTLPGITRGNHYHHTKTEKFFVVEGLARIRMRQIHGSEVAEYIVSGEEFRVIDIPPGFTHSIENIGSGILITLFWASEIFDPNRTDTWFLPVEPPATVSAG